ncbi:MAG TPA: hypothetical protein VNP04_13155 [Alphaproteobacteria bacterium]|nr:hypothetical protein [Alphaproteobacteria bacterium]
MSNDVVIPVALFIFMYVVVRTLLDPTLGPPLPKGERDFPVGQIIRMLLTSVLPSEGRPSLTVQNGLPVRRQPECEGSPTLDPSPCNTPPSPSL